MLCLTPTISSLLLFFALAAEEIRPYAHGQNSNPRLRHSNSHHASEILPEDESSWGTFIRQLASSMESPRPTASPTQLEMPSPSYVPSQGPTAGIMPFFCPTPEPVVCPTPEPTPAVVCPSPEPTPAPQECPPVVCPTPEPTPVVHCPTSAPQECPPVTCPTPEPTPVAFLPTMEPTATVVCPPVVCPSPEPSAVVECPTPEPTSSMTCPPVTCPSPEPAPTVAAPVVCPTPDQVQLIPATAGDDCANHYSLAINGDPVIGSTINATAESRQDDVHYSFVGNGRHVRITTCFEETATAHNFFLRSGSCGGTGFGETGSDLECPWNAGAAAYEFDTTAGRLYPIIVYPRGDTQGQFAIQVTDFINPENDYCANGVSLSINGDPVVGSTVNATDETRTDDVHYSFVGNGRHVRISTCFDETTTPHNFLLRGGSCGGTGFGETANYLNCASNAGAAEFEFDTVDGTIYPINVYPRNAGNQGQFAIQVTDFINPANDYCSNSVSLVIDGAPMVGSTVNATDETRIDDVHYSFTGNGGRVLVSTCFNETTTPHNFLLRGGSCGGTGFGETSGDPTCTSNAAAAGFEFDTVAGTVYPINVYPRNAGSQGQFAIQVTSVEE